MEWFFVYLPALACAGMMVAICLPMMRRMSAGKYDDPSASASREEVAELREEVARLRAERALAAHPDEVTDG